MNIPLFENITGNKDGYALVKEVFKEMEKNKREKCKGDGKEVKKKIQIVCDLDMIKTEYVYNERMSLLDGPDRFLTD